MDRTMGTPQTRFDLDASIEYSVIEAFKFEKSPKEANLQDDSLNSNNEPETKGDYSRNFQAKRMAHY